MKKPSFIYSKIGKKTLIKHKKAVYLKMQHIQGIQRHQLQMHSLKDKIGIVNKVRFTDAFVEHISLTYGGFTVQSVKSEGRPRFDTEDFPKIYLCI